MLLLFTFILTLLIPVSAENRPKSKATPHVLVYYRALADATHGYVHPSIPCAVASLRAQGPSHGVSFDLSE